MTTGHQLGTLILATQQCLLLLVITVQILGALEEDMRESTVTLDPDNDLTLRTLTRVTLANGAGMMTPSWSLIPALSLTLPAVDSSRDTVHRSPHLVTLSLTHVITTRQTPTTLPATRGWLGAVTWPG